jgi:hypothetical protein
MIFSQFVQNTSEYLHSVRVIKDHLSFDFKFPVKWTVLKSHVEGIEVIPAEGQSKDTTTKIYSLEINKLEDSFKNIVKYNLERQEKEKLFQTKIQELKSIFEKEQLDSLRNLKIDLEVSETLLEDETEGDRQNDVLVQDGTDKGQ